MLGAALLSAQTAEERPVWSPDRKLYAVELPGQKVGKGEERERFAIYDSEGKPVSVIHIWEIEPDGTYRVGIRGCEDQGWIDPGRFFCSGSINPSTGVYLFYDATTGKELGERLGTEFTWSPDGSQVANFGSVPHFLDAESKSDSLEVGKFVYPGGPDGERHRFRSEILWSPDSRYAAVIDHRCRKQNAFYVIVMEATTGKWSEYKLHWSGEPEEWPPELDFAFRWNGNRIVVDYDGAEEAISLR